MFKRIGLFLLINALVVISISLVLNLLNVQPYLNEAGINFSALIIFCLVWGMGGAFISLLMSKFVAKKMMGVEVITQQTARSELEIKLLQKVYHLSRSAGLSKLPEVGIYSSDEINAFATGSSQRNSLVAVSTGLLNAMNEEEVTGVLAHEIAHIKNGDMVTMTLLQGIINAFVMFLARIIAFILTSAFNRGNDREESRGGGFMYMLTVFALEWVLMIFGMMAIAFFSRSREYRADKGGAALAGRRPMVAALEALKRNYQVADSNQSVATLKINNLTRSRLLKLFATHPDLNDRIRALEKVN